MKKTLKKTIIIILSVLLCLVLVAGGALLYLMIPTVTIDFSSQSELTGRASGFLYGFAEDDIPTREIAESIGINALATKTAGGLQHPIGDVRDVSDTFLSAGGEMLMVYTQDMYDTWYYQLDSLPEYNEKVRKTVTEMENSSYRDSLVYCIYNEMDNGAWLGNFWEEENRYKFYEAWKETYSVVKGINPEAKIAGPGHCGYNYDFIKEFLSYCKENDCLPEVVVWHELSDQSIYWMESNFEGYYSICEELGIERLLVCISEYGLMSTNGISGESVKWISRLEAEDAYGCVAYWRLANNLSDTVADDVTPNSNYWVYNFYAKMKGRELETEEWDMMHSNIGNWLKGKYPLMNKGFIALASYDETEEKFYILAGGSDKDSKIVIDNLDGAFTNGDKFTVKTSYVDYKGLGGAVIAPVLSETKNITVRNGKLSFTVPCERESQAFFIEITKGDGESYENPVKTVRYEAEDVEINSSDITVEGGAYALSGGKCIKSASSDRPPFVFKVKAEKSGTYMLDLVYGNVNYTGGQRTVAEVKFTIGDKEYFVKCPSSVKLDCMECVSIEAELIEGDNEIKIEVQSDSNLISIDFLDVTEKTDVKVYSDRLTSRNTKEENAYFAIIPYDGYYKLSDLTDDGEITINGTEIKGDGDGIFYFGRGYNKVVLPEGVTFSSAEPVVSETEAFTPDDVTLIGEALAEEDINTSTGKRIGWISSETDSGIEFKVNAREEGYYAFTVEYANNEEGGYHDYNVDLVERYISISVNGEKQGNFFFRSTYSWDNYKTKTIVLKLSEGENIITFTNDGSYSFNNKVTYAPDIGSITVNPVR